METIETFFQWIYQSHGINLSIGDGAWNRAQFLGGLWVMVKLSILLSLAVGVAETGRRVRRIWRCGHPPDCS
ncbi:hypothetical protein [Paenirhodobacter sp.]|uniref:hypothetical protein n=1 Tax=Paenirhodobacter sp. TaxID=1965326 RepID=UPI003B3FF203